MESERDRHGREEEYIYRTVFVNLKEGVTLEDRTILVDGREIFQWIIKKHC
jgi:hypothetical protein